MGKNTKVGKVACVATAKKVEGCASWGGSKAVKVKGGDGLIAGDTWDKYRSRVFKRAAKEAIEKGMSSTDAWTFRQKACAAAKIDWAAMSAQH